MASNHPRKAYLNDYALKIGNRASLISSEGKRFYGVVMTVDKVSIDKLYSEPSVADYIPEEVKIITETDDSIVVTCYNLPVELLTGTNTTYASSLYGLAKTIRVPRCLLKRNQTL